MTDPKLTPHMARNIELWPVARLVPYDRNSRTHTDAQVAQVAASIIEFGFTNPTSAVPHNNSFCAILSPLVGALAPPH